LLKINAINIRVMADPKNVNQISILQELPLRTPTHFRIAIARRHARGLFYFAAW
jgi:hypothetical protein